MPALLVFAAGTLRAGVHHHCPRVAAAVRRGKLPSFRLQDVGWHNVEVRLNLENDMRDLELKARTRASYYAPHESEQ